MVMETWVCQGFPGLNIFKEIKKIYINFTEISIVNIVNFYSELYIIIYIYIYIYIYYNYEIIKIFIGLILTIVDIYRLHVFFSK